MQIDGISATSMQTDGVHTPPMQSGGVSALTCMNSVIDFSLRQSLFPHRYILPKKNQIYLPRGQICAQYKKIYARIKQLYAQLKQYLLPYRFGSDKLLKFLCNQYRIALTVRGEG